MLDRISKNFVFSKFLFKFFIVYLIIGTCFSVFLYSMFIEKITLAIECLDVRRSASGLDFEKLNDLTIHEDVTGVYILDASNNVVHVSKGLKFLVKESLSFSRSLVSDDSFIINDDPATIYTPINTRGILEKSCEEYRDLKPSVPMILSKNYKSIRTENFRMFEMKNGQKVFITMSIIPVKHSEIVTGIYKFFLLSGIFIYWFSLVLWAYKKAVFNSLNPVAWSIVVMLTNSIGALALIYVTYKLKISRR